MMENYLYMVCVQCHTYNHIHYIEEALYGFEIQNTSFPVVYIVIDDASTDGTQVFLRQWAVDNLDENEKDFAYRRSTSYGEVIHARNRNNNKATFVIILLSENHYQNGRNEVKDTYMAEWVGQSKYLAFCEGDDYWFMPYKLQRQIDFLEKNQDYSLCFHNAVIVYDDISKAAKVFNDVKEDCEITMEQLLGKWIVPTASIVFRSSVLPLFPVSKPFISGDWRLILHCAAFGKVWAMKAVMSVYRKTYHSSSSASRHTGKLYEVTAQKIDILKGLDDYTDRGLHEIFSKYIDRYEKQARYYLLNNKYGGIVACILTPNRLIEKLKIRIPSSKSNKRIK